MSMGIEFKNGVSMAQIDTGVKLGVYLSGAIEAMSNASSLKEAEKLCDKYMERKPLKSVDKKTAVQMIDHMEKETKKDIKATPLKTKVMSALNGSDGVKAVALGLATVVAGTAAANGVDCAASIAALTFAGTLSCGGYAAFGLSDKTKEMKDYAELKHTQIALKKIKQQVVGKEKSSYKDEVRNLMASGLGNPGGFITALKLNQGRN
ncbi:MAG: hypothetical protein MJ247_06760 [Alphaproteobacteria bacterium]|nr:hypothetical protein [Alphaproteobacteria bacterium]